MNSSAAFIFDMDGVIVDSNPAHKVALKQFCKKYGRDLSENELREKIYGRRNQDWLMNVFGQLEPQQLRAYAAEKEALFRQIYEPDIKPLKGLANFLAAIRAANIPTAIATSAPRDNVDFTLAKTGLSSYFDTVLDDSFVKKGKPDPEVYLKAAEVLNYDPARCIVFEDSLAGVESGKNAGCKVIGLTTTHTVGELRKTDMVIEDFEGIDPKNLIARLF